MFFMLVIFLLYDFGGVVDRYDGMLLMDWFGFVGMFLSQFYYLVKRNYVSVIMVFLSLSVIEVMVVVVVSGG